ncbi:unnamed protein product [Bursaphelenchus okinawaensis]|uniref:EGF-like domain-containing protein n=1 Tax=Bursaphelenchus okinawaensis TaxID=465554 RepID=A0A811KCV5_9BILA|nr:unnamed protein product [Bursaphelenchus okinawaensis]CAG9099405.1 unnamed protein product [Bursaphelenchus okinawaensis]
MSTFACPPPFDEYYCHNGGRCLADPTSEGGFTPFCQCQANFSGPRCQNTFNPNIYGFATVGVDNSVRQYTFMLLIMLLFLVIFMGFIWYLYRTRQIEDNETVTFVNSRPLCSDGSIQTLSVWTA